jgi:hypothetical protein
MAMTDLARLGLWCFAWPLVPVGCYGADRLNPAAQLRYLGLVGWLSAPVGIRLLGGWLWQSYYY